MTEHVLDHVLFEPIADRQGTAVSVAAHGWMCKPWSRLGRPGRILSGQAACIKTLAARGSLSSRPDAAFKQASPPRTPGTARNP
ncbi:MAG: hypothetical protein MZU91_01185 [Desulfosudis oleivorans]|nr:hypothetical protein [Desulfosudis oleivorans]